MVSETLQNQFMKNWWTLLWYVPCIESNGHKLMHNLNTFNPQNLMFLTSLSLPENYYMMQSMLDSSSTLITSHSSDKNNSDKAIQKEKPSGWKCSRHCKLACLAKMSMRAKLILWLNNSAELASTIFHTGLNSQRSVSLSQVWYCGK